MPEIDDSEPAESGIAKVNQAIRMVDQNPTPPGKTFAELVAYLATNDFANASDGAEFSANGVTFTKKATSTLISTAHGVEPKDDWTPMHWGADPTGATDSASAVLGWGRACRDNGETYAVPRGTFQLDTAVEIDAITRDTHVVLGPGVSFTTGSITDAALRFTGTAATQAFFLRGGDVDTSAADFVTAEGSGTGINFTRFRRGEVSGVHVKSTQVDVPLWENWRTNGDSGVGCVDVSEIIFENCFFEGIPDAGLYPGGNNSNTDVDDGGFCTFSKCFFKDCWSGVSLKRQMQKCCFDQCHFIDCRSGLTIVEVNSTEPGREIRVTNCFFTRCGSRPLRIQSAGYPAFVLGNHFIDVGYDRDGTTPLGAGAFITLEGIQGGEVAHNFFGYERWTPAAGHEAIRLDRYTATHDSSTHDCQNIRIADNTAEGVATFLLEEANQGPSFGSGNRLVGVTTPFTRTHVDSWLQYTDDTNPEAIRYVGGAGLDIQLNGQSVLPPVQTATPTFIFAGDMTATFDYTDPDITTRQAIDYIDYGTHVEFWGSIGATVTHALVGSEQLRINIPWTANTSAAFPVSVVVSRVDNISGTAFSGEIVGGENWIRLRADNASTTVNSSNVTSGDTIRVDFAGSVLK